jgi:hypothetical protein
MSTSTGAANDLHSLSIRNKGARVIVLCAISV